MDRPTSQLVWAGLLGYCGDPIAARAALRTDLPPAEALRTGFEQLEHVRPDDGPTLIDFSAVSGDSEAIRGTVDLLSALPDQLRADVLVSVLTGEAVPSQAVSAAVAELEQRAERSITEVVEPLAKSTPVEDVPASPISRKLVAIGAGLAVTAAFGVLAWAWGQPRPQPESASPATVASTSVPPTTARIDLGPLLVNPDRSIDVALTANGLVERRDPGSGEIIWQAGPYVDATWIRLDLNTVTVDRGRRGRIFVNLIDGTLMPP